MVTLDRLLAEKRVFPAMNIKRSGTWLYVTPYPPTAYLQKPPLYFWLTALTYDAFDPAAVAEARFDPSPSTALTVLPAHGANTESPKITYARASSGRMPRD